MSIQDAYNDWASDYDSAANKTRDLEAEALRRMVTELEGKRVLELGCGTGKNGAWLAERAARYVGLDFSEEMLAVARGKIEGEDVGLFQADLTQPWPVADGAFDWATCSLVLEHIADLGFVFEEAARKLVSGGRFYIGEYHPFKQYLGKTARYEREGETVEVEAFVHHASDFVRAAKGNGFRVVEMEEWFDGGGREGIPRLITFIFEK